MTDIIEGEIISETKRSPWAKASPAQDKLNAYPEILDELCDHVAAGKGYRAFCADIGVSMQSLFTWMYAVPDRRARVEACQGIAAESYADRATAALEACTNKDDVPKAAALAKHYQWMASKHNKKYADNRHIEVTGSVSLASAIRELDADEESPAIEHEGQARLVDNS